MPAIRAELDYDYRIMKSISCALLLLAAAAFALPAGVKAAPSEYATIAARLQAGETNVDYGRLRISYMESPEYKNAGDTSAAEKAMWDALNANDFAGALASANKILASNYVHMDGHYVAFVANRELHNPDKAQFHRTVFLGLLDSIRNSGDGLSPEKAWVVISVAEEYVLLRYLRMHPGTQTTLNQGGHIYDVMKVTDEKGAEHTFYFNVDIPFKHYGF